MHQAAVVSTLHLRLYHSLDGLAVEVTGLPMFSPKEWENRDRQIQMASEELKRLHPELLVRRCDVCSADTVILYVEPA